MQEPGERRSALRQLDISSREVERALLHAPNAVGTMPRRSCRRMPARKHAALVAGALRAQLLRVDAEPREGLTALGSMLVVISERCAEGRVGAMLPEGALSSVTPVSTARTTLRESVHIAFAILTAMGAAVAASACMQPLGISAGLRPWMVLGCSVLSAIVVGGWHRVGRILEVFPGK